MMKSYENQKGLTTYLLISWFMLYFQGVLSVHGSPVRCVVQAVHELYDSHFTTPWLPQETRKNVVVFIGERI